MAAVVLSWIAAIAIIDGMNGILSIGLMFLLLFVIAFIPDKALWR